MDPAMVAPLAVYLLADAAADVTGQVFAVRANEIFLMSQSRPLRSVHRPEGWTPQSVADHAIPALRANFYGPDMSKDVFSWDPILAEGTWWARFRDCGSSNSPASEIGRAQV